MNKLATGRGEAELNQHVAAESEGRESDAD